MLLASVDLAGVETVARVDVGRVTDEITVNVAGSKAVAPVRAGGVAGEGAVDVAGAEAGVRVQIGRVADDQTVARPVQVDAGILSAADAVVDDAKAGQNDIAFVEFFAAALGSAVDTVVTAADVQAADR